MRLFVAAEPSAAVRQAAARIGSALQDTTAAALSSARVRWIPAINLHLTVWFLGEVAEPRASEVLEALSPQLDLKSFRLALGGLGAFPPSGSPRVLWLGVRDGIDALTRANALVGARLAPLGFEPERRRFSAHLTLARINTPLPQSSRRSLREALERQSAEAGSCTVDGLTVFRSHTAPTGAVYEPVLRVPLK